MKRETMIWTVIMLAGAAGLIANGVLRGAGSAYVTAAPKEFVNVGSATEPTWIDVESDDAFDHDVAAVPEAQRIRFTRYDDATLADYARARKVDPAQTACRFSLSRTVGVWAAALFTLFIFSFLYRDNPFYKVAESVVVGVSAAYWMVVGFWEVIVPNLFGKIWPAMVKAWSMPGLDEPPSPSYYVPLILGIMLLWRLAPAGAWISRWPLAFIIGTTAGIRLIGFIHADFLSQIRNSIIPLYVTTPEGVFSLSDSIKNGVLIVGILAGLVYFFFSIEHKGIVGKTANLGTYFLMVTFGAAFGYTVMGRIALLAIRLEFLFDDWLWLIDPTNRRAIDAGHAMLQPAASALGLA